MTLSLTRALTDRIIWPERREVPCRDLDLDCFAFDGLVPFGDYGRCQAYAPELGRCIFLPAQPEREPHRLEF
jgi:hypothetical protein